MKDRITLRHIKYMLAAAIGIFVILAFLLCTAAARHTRVQTVRGQTAGQKTECYRYVPENHFGRFQKDIIHRNIRT